MSALAGGSTKGALREAYANVDKCASCFYVSKGQLFTLCNHPAAMYLSNGAPDRHTIQHMRDVHVGRCGEEARLWEAP